MAVKNKKKAKKPKQRIVGANDNISKALDAVGIIPPGLRGSTDFLDVVTWNIKWFHDRDPNRVSAIVKVLQAINADLFVFQEILDGSMDTVAAQLTQTGAGHYVAKHGTTGGQQRVAVMWDLDWVRAKNEITELFGPKSVVTPDGKDAFPRLPLVGHFTALEPSQAKTAFDFQICGVHLKSQMGGGGAQRELAAQWLAHWFKHEAPTVDSDVILLGDWNEAVTTTTWKAFRELELEGTALFEQINDKSEISHFYYKNKHDIGSRLDLVAVTMVSSEQLVDKKSKVVQWAPLTDLLAAMPSAEDLKAYLKTIGGDRKGKGGISDHLPVLTRFHYSKQGAR